MSGWEVWMLSRRKVVQSSVKITYTYSFLFRTFSQGPKKQGCFTCPEEVFLCDSCEKTEFGCCPDLQSAPAGPDFEGCPDEDGEIYEDCTLTEYAVRADTIPANSQHTTSQSSDSIGDRRLPEPNEVLEVSDFLVECNL